jgi:hypothetical protein
MHLQIRQTRPTITRIPPTTEKMIMIILIVKAFRSLSQAGRES